MIAFRGVGLSGVQEFMDDGAVVVDDVRGMVDGEEVARRGFW